MVYRPSKILVWLSLVAAALLLLGAFAPISDPWDTIMSRVGLVLLLAYIAITWRVKRRLRQAN